ncbi:hypothetical protein O4J56_13785 [Nocardiopsis sp. RSe5-2]|uniref:DUF2929 family protein n=1 Tax=Nocardiopsis endophytica TaxID=3018445 RepID=A0ABT4U5T6_9ACTN|nr:hypothetical protein [Nocardiopsis endophytica]MDA2811707.1 hypothetical protein [Nocardiopsis endophytica]
MTTSQTTASASKAVWIAFVVLVALNIGQATGTFTHLLDIPMHPAIAGASMAGALATLGLIMVQILSSSGPGDR